MRSYVFLGGVGFLVFALVQGAAAQNVSVKPGAGGRFKVKKAADSSDVFDIGEATGNISRNGALFVHTTGTDNIFVGEGAGNTSTTGSANSAFGGGSLTANTTGDSNSAFGEKALYSNTTGNNNTAFGYLALTSNTSGNLNSAFGHGALQLTTGGDNAAFGVSALVSNTTGNFNGAFVQGALGGNSAGYKNVAIGYRAGTNQTTGSNNIYIANPGVAGESTHIRIGQVGYHGQTHIAGISGAYASGGVNVLVAADGTLGTQTSSVRFKRDVQDMGEASELLMALRPVTFRFREEVDEGRNVRQYGLIAEEVAEVAPELVALDREGNAHSVRYHVLPPLLLNEMQKQQAVIAALRSRLDEVEQQLGAGADR